MLKDAYSIKLASCENTCKLIMALVLVPHLLSTSRAVIFAKLLNDSSNTCSLLM